MRPAIARVAVDLSRARVRRAGPPQRCHQADGPGAVLTAVREVALPNAGSPDLASHHGTLERKTSEASCSRREDTGCALATSLPTPPARQTRTLDTWKRV